MNTHREDSFLKWFNEEAKLESELEEFPYYERGCLRMSENGLLTTRHDEECDAMEQPACEYRGERKCIKFGV